MESKEALSSLKEEYYIENDEHIITFDADDDRLKIIEKDLEILEQYKNIEEGLGIDLINLLNAKSVYIATFLYWRWNLRDKQQCKKDDIGAIEEKRIEEESNFCIDLINKEIVIIESKLVDDFDYKTKITKLKFKDYGKTWALTKEELIDNDK